MKTLGFGRFARHSAGALALPLCLVVALAGCGGGGSSDTVPTEPNMVITPPVAASPAYSAIATGHNTAGDVVYGWALGYGSQTTSDKQFSHRMSKCWRWQ